MRQSSDRGDTLIEIVIAVVIIGITVSALVSSLGAAGTSAQFQRTSVETDTVMRNYAEATKAAARTCPDSGSYAPAFDPPSGYAISTEPSGGACPAAATSQPLVLSVTGPTGVQQQMQIVIRSP
jgi:prepilin-type N-terminal cleavage/methylation domain-containing protein